MNEQFHILMEKILNLKKIIISLEKEKEDMPLGQTAIFTFNVTGIGILGGTSFETNIDNIPANWTAGFEPKSFIAEKDDWEYMDHSSLLKGWS